MYGEVNLCSLPRLLSMVLFVLCLRLSHRAIPHNRRYYYLYSWPLRFICSSNRHHDAANSIAMFPSWLYLAHRLQFLRFLTYFQATICCSCDRGLQSRHLRHRHMEAPVHSQRVGNQAAIMNSLLRDGVYSQIRMVGEVVLISPAQVCAPIRCVLWLHGKCKLDRMCKVLSRAPQTGCNFINFGRYRYDSIERFIKFGHKHIQCCQYTR